MIGLDVRRLRAKADENPGRTLSVEEASTVAGYARTLAACVARKPTGGAGRSGDLQELIEEAMKIPELREALMRAGH